MLGALDEAGLHHIGDGHVAGALRVQIPDIDDLEVLGEMGVEAALGHATLQRRLTAFEVHAYGTALAGGLAFAAATGGLALAGAGAATDLETLLARALVGPEIQTASFYFLDLHEMGDDADHSVQRCAFFPQ